MHVPHLLLPMVLSFISLVCGESMSSFTFGRFALEETPTVYSIVYSIDSVLRCAAVCSGDVNASLCSGFQVLNGACLLFSGDIETGEFTSTPTSGIDVGYKLLVPDVSSVTPSTNSVTSTATSNLDVTTSTTSSPPMATSSTSSVNVATSTTISRSVATSTTSSVNVATLTTSSEPLAISTTSSVNVATLTTSSEPLAISTTSSVNVATSTTSSEPMAISTSPTHTATVTPPLTSTTTTAGLDMTTQPSSTLPVTMTIVTPVTSSLTSSSSFTFFLLPLPPVTITPLACSSFPDFVVKHHNIYGQDRYLCMAAISSPGTLSQAQAECSSRGAIVAFPEEGTETFSIQEVFYDAFMMVPNLWLGVVYNSSTGVWDGGRSGQFIDNSFDRWDTASGQPDPSGNKHCVFAPNSGQAYSKSCLEVYDYVCEKYDVTF